MSKLENEYVNNFKFLTVFAEYIKYIPIKEKIFHLKTEGKLYSSWNSLKKRYFFQESSD